MPEPAVPEPAVPDNTGTLPGRPVLVLASSSPSRLSVLRAAGTEPLVVVPDVDEDAAVAELTDRLADRGVAPTPEPTVVHLAEVKADSVAGRLAADGGRDTTAGVLTGDPGPDLLSDAVIVAGDSMLLLDGRLQGKPHTVERTVERWKAQRGRTATLVTGHAVVHRGRRISVASSTQVHFARVSDRDIEAYAATGEPLECAGAFTLEALGGWFIDRVDGDPSGVIGLSLPVLRRALEEFGLSVSDFWTR